MTKEKTNEQLEEEVLNLAGIVHNLMKEQIKMKTQVETTLSMFHEFMRVAKVKPFSPVEETK